MYFRKLLSQTDCLKTKLRDLDVIRTRNLLICSQTRNHCAMKYRQRLVPKKIKKLLECWKVKERLCLKQMYFRKLVSQIDCLKIKLHDLDVIRTRNLLIWSQTRNHCAMKYKQRLVPKKLKK